MAADFSSIKMDEMMAENWASQNSAGGESKSQAIGRALFDLGYEGVLVPSAIDKRGNNLFYFPKNLRESSQIRIVGKEELETWLK